MATLPTGSARLSALPRAPRLDTQDFALDVEGIARAATAPTRVAETIEAFGQRQRDRRIDKATFEDRLAIATEEERRRRARQPDVETLADIQAQSAALLAPGAERLKAMQQTEAVEDFGMGREMRQANTAATLEEARRRKQQAAQEFAIAEQTEAQIIGTARDEATAKAFETQERARAAEGRAGQRVVVDAQGNEMLQEGYWSPTGDQFNVTKETLRRSSREISLDEANRKAAEKRAEAYATSIEQAGQGRKQFFLRDYEDSFGNKQFKAFLFDPQTGQVTEVPADQTQQTGDNLESQLFGEEPVTPTMSATPEFMDQETNRQGTMTVEGVTFTPTGRQVNPRIPVGAIYEENGIRYIYTGGELIRRNLIPIQ